MGLKNREGEAKGAGFIWVGKRRQKGTILHCLKGIIESSSQRCTVEEQNTVSAHTSESDISIRVVQHWKRHPEK